MLKIPSFSIKTWLILVVVFCFANVSVLMLYFVFEYCSSTNSVTNVVFEGPPKCSVTNVVFEGPPKCSEIQIDRRQNCLPYDKANESLCLEVGCCWDEDAIASPVPACYFPKNIIRYEVTTTNKTKRGINATLTLKTKSGLPSDVPTLKVVVTFCGRYMLRLKITDAENDRYEVPLHLDTESCNSSEETMLYTADLFKNGTFTVQSKPSNIVIFSTDFSFLLFADQLLQISSPLPSSRIFGLGDHMGSLLRSTNWTKYTFFNRDQIPEENWNLYSSFPFYKVMDDGGCTGVYLFNSNAMDVILQPQPAITLRAVGGILDFFIFRGYGPENVMQQFTKLVGRPSMPPYWSLGFHLCRLGYFTLNKTIEVWKRTVDAGIPFDVQWNDIDYMDKYNDFTFDEENFTGLPEFVNHLHDVGMHYVMIIDPGISSAEKAGTYKPFDDGLALDIFIKNSSGQLLKTKVWNKISSVFPDFTHPSAAAYWKTQLSNFHSIVNFDGIWLDMNEPTNFLNGSFEGCPKNSSLEHPPYTPGHDALYTKTLCMSAKHFRHVHYNLHNVYGTFETEATYNALATIRKKRPFILTRAGFPGISRFAAMWNGDVLSAWEHMRASIPSILSFSLAGIPNIGTDICGFNDNTTVELCARWFQLGAFYPFSRNHNSDENIEQDPVALGPIVIAAAKQALTTRYLLLPYLYTLMYLNHMYGTVVARPAFYEYYVANATYYSDDVFMWGPALLILPALEPGVTTISRYIPPDIWYDFYTGKTLKYKHGKCIMDAPLDKINLAVVSRNIIPIQEPNATTTLSRKNKFSLIIALGYQGAEGFSYASGNLYWDDGESLDVDVKKTYNFIAFEAFEYIFTSTPVHVGYKTEMILDNITIFGMTGSEPAYIRINGKKSETAYDKKDLYRITNLNLSLLQRIEIHF